MDRTQDSDSCNVGSIPAGCISFYLILEAASSDVCKFTKLTWDSWERKEGRSGLPPVCNRSEKAVFSGGEVWYSMGSSKDIKDIQYNKDNNSVVDFIKEHIRYIAAAVLFLLLIVVLVFLIGGKKDSEPPAGTESENFQKNAYPEVNELIQNYFNAYAAGDLETLMQLATPVSEKEQGYIALFSQFVERYQNMDFYTKSGLDSNSYMVSVYVEIKFEGVDTAAPGMDFFYVRTAEDGSLYIDNLYSQYNMRNKENALDTSIKNLIDKYESSDDVATMLERIQLKYVSVVESDENLANMLNITIPQAVSEWVASRAESSPGETENPDESTEGEPSEGEPTDTPPEPETEQVPEQVSENVKATSLVNVRAAADAGADKLGEVASGTILTRIGTEGEWSIVEYNGGTGYIKSEFLTTDLTSVSEGDAPASNGLPEGTEITLQETTNIRSSMNETADKVGVAYPGEKVTVVMSYAEGWTKVTWNGQTGYIKTELLQ